MRLDAADAGQRIGAALARSCSRRVFVRCSIITTRCLAPMARSMAPPDGRNRVGRAGVPVGEVARGRHLEGAEHAEVEMAAAHHREASRRGGRYAPPGSSVTGCLPALMRSWSSSPVARRGAHAEEAVLAVQDDLAVLRQVVGHQRRQADAEVDVGALGDVAGDARGHLVAAESLHGERPRCCLKPAGRFAAARHLDHALHEDARA